MASSPRSPLTALQGELLDAFFARESRFFLTGGGALAGFYFHHRTTEDLDLFSAPGPDLEDAERNLTAAAAVCGASTIRVQAFPDFRRLLASRGEERCLVDLVIDRAPAVDPGKSSFGAIRVDTLREIAANKLCAILGRSQIKDLVDLEPLLGSGLALEQVLLDARRKDAGLDPATLAWVLEQITISAEARLPGGVEPGRIDLFRRELVRRLQLLAFEQARKS